tara:strand:- start:1124 stop:1690 length:567 start_codon:yes stop_codon:yes gene_type:complete
MGIKSQSATEYLMVVGFVMLILIPGVYLYTKYSAESQDSITNVKIDAISNEIIKAADQVYSYGEGSQTTVSVDFPKNVVEIIFGGNIFGGNEDDQNKEIVFKVVNSKGGVSEIAKVANVFLVGKITIVQGLKKITILSLGNEISVYASCSEEEEDMPGTEIQCQYHIEEYDGNGCDVICENNQWVIVQ